jgi:hypothetical protein
MPDSPKQGYRSLVQSACKKIGWDLQGVVCVKTVTSVAY